MQVALPARHGPGSSRACARAPARSGARSTAAASASRHRASRPRSRNPTASSCASTLASILVGLRPPRRLAHGLRVGQHDPPHMRLDDPRDRHRVRGRLDRDLVAVDQATARTASSARGSVATRPAARTAAVLGDRDLTEVAMHVHPDASHQHPPSSTWTSRERAGERDNYGSVLSAHPDTRGGGQLQTAGAQPIETPACPTTALSHEPPHRDHEPKLRPRPDSEPHAQSSWPYNHDRVHHGRLTRGRIPADLINGARKMEPK